MKQLIFLEMLSRVRSSPNLKRKLKIFAIAGAIGFTVISGLVIWVAVSVTRFASHQIQAVNIQQQAETFENRLKTLPAVATMSCWDKAQSLMNLDSWVSRPIAENLNNLKMACLEESAPVCEGKTCQNLKIRMNTAESGEII